MARRGRTLPGEHGFDAVVHAGDSALPLPWPESIDSKTAPWASASPSAPSMDFYKKDVSWKRCFETAQCTLTAGGIKVDQLSMPSMSSMSSMSSMALDTGTDAGKDATSTVPTFSLSKLPGKQKVKAGGMKEEGGRKEGGRKEKGRRKEDGLVETERKGY